MHTHGNLIVLPHWETRSSKWWPHSVTLSGHWSNQSLPHPNNAERLAMIAWSDKHTFLSHWFDLTRVWTSEFRFDDRPKQDTDAQLIWQSHLVVNHMPAVYCILFVCIVDWWWVEVGLLRVGETLVISIHEIYIQQDSNRMLNYCPIFCFKLLLPRRMWLENKGKKFLSYLPLVRAEPEMLRLLS